MKLNEQWHCMCDELLEYCSLQLVHALCFCSCFLMCMKNVKLCNDGLVYLAVAHQKVSFWDCYHCISHSLY